MSSSASRFRVVLGALALALSAVAPAGANVISVPGDSPTIQGGINLALPGDSVVVASGVYPEHLNLRSNVSVFGQDAATTIVDGGGVAIDVVRAINITNARFQGFTVTGAISGGGLPGGAGVFVNHALGHHRD